MITKTLTIKTALLCVGFAFVTSCSNDSHSDNTNKDPKEQAEDINDEKFNNEGEKAADKLVDAYSSNLFEIKASEHALTRASLPEVKKLAGMLAEAHKKMNEDVERLAQTKNVTLPTDLSDDERKKIEKLSEKTGINYDKEYADLMEDKHDEAVKNYEKMADKGDDAEIKQWAAQTLPQIRSHQDMVEATRNTVKDLKRERTKDKWDGDNVHDGKENIPSAKEVR
jgi:putative membrane protein